MHIARHPSDGEIGLSEAEKKKEIEKLLNNDSGSN